ncbi:hypothetical protein, partial [Pseudomonas viridiflava]|uniref:hypothetical protein n=1 Tax=Pseudomonas viridiflava TaxID=33069 RepID=UPI000F060A5E
SHQLCGLLFRHLLSKIQAAQKICQMVKKSPISDKAITGYKMAESLAGRGIYRCGKLSQSLLSPIKNAQFLWETGRL